MPTQLFGYHRLRDVMDPLHDILSHTWSFISCCAEMSAGYLQISYHNICRSFTLTMLVATIRRVKWVTVFGRRLRLTKYLVCIKWKQHQRPAHRRDDIIRLKKKKKKKKWRINGRANKREIDACYGWRTILIGTILTQRCVSGFHPLHMLLEMGQMRAPRPTTRLWMWEKLQRW